MKLIIAGSRSFPEDIEILDKLLHQDIPETLKQVTGIVCGYGKGADTAGRLWAEYRALQIYPFFPNWKRYGRAAGPIRNKEMAKEGDYLYALWDGKSRGTFSMIKEMQKTGKTVFIHLFDESEYSCPNNNSLVLDVHLPVSSSTKIKK